MYVHTCEADHCVKRLWIKSALALFIPGAGLRVTSSASPAPGDAGQVSFPSVPLEDPRSDTFDVLSSPNSHHHRQPKEKKEKTNQKFSVSS